MIKPNYRVTTILHCHSVELEIEDDDDRNIRISAARGWGKEENYESPLSETAIHIYFDFALGNIFSCVLI